MRTPPFVVFEGPHWSGKTTQAKLLVRAYQRSGIRATYTKEPFLDDIRALVAAHLAWDDPTSGYTLMYLHAADRYNHLEFVREQTRGGRVVVGDRYLLSGLVYQNLQGVALRVIQDVNTFCLEPAVTFCLEVPYKLRKDRMFGSPRGKGGRRIPERVLRAEDRLFRMASRVYGQRWRNVVLVDANRAATEIHAEILARLAGLGLPAP